LLLQSRGVEALIMFLSHMAHPIRKNHASISPMKCVNIKNQLSAFQISPAILSDCYQSWSKLRYFAIDEINAWPSSGKSIYVYDGRFPNWYNVWTVTQCTGQFIDFIKSLYSCCATTRSLLTAPLRSRFGIQVRTLRRCQTLTTIILRIGVNFKNADHRWSAMIARLAANPQRIAWMLFTSPPFDFAQIKVETEV